MSETKRRRAVIYCRISRDKTGGGLGVSRQEGDCRELAERLDVDLVAEPYVDNDMSAYSGKPRPKYRKMLAAVSAGQVDVVLSWHTDRLHRSPSELEEWITVCEPRGVAVHTVKAGPIDLSSPSGRAVARTLGAWARYESEHRAERVASKKDETARQGGFMGGTRPFGYAKDGMELVEPEAKLIRNATEGILSGTLSLRQAVAQFNASGLLTTKAGKAWEPIAVRDVLMRERNAGLLVHRGKVVGKAAWPRIVTEEQWRGVCAVLTDPKRRTSPGNTPRWLGSGLYLCGICGGGLVVGTTGQHRNPSYTCRVARDVAGTRHVTRAAPTLDTYVTDVLVARLSEPDAVGMFVRPGVSAAELDAIRAELFAVEADRVELAARMGTGAMTWDEFDAMKTPMDRRHAALEASLAAAVSTGPTAALATADDVRAAWDGMALETRRAVLAELLVVTVHQAPRGRRPDGTYFDAASVELRWR